jgi:hypothetical protein
LSGRKRSKLISTIPKRVSASATRCLEEANLYKPYPVRTVAASLQGRLRATNRTSPKSIGWRGVPPVVSCVNENTNVKDSGIYALREYLTDN